MFLMLDTIAHYLALGIAVFLLVLGIVFVMAPEKGLAMTRHRAETLPTIMAGRYFFMALIALGVAFRGTGPEVAFVAAGLAAVALFDALTYYRAGTSILPHIGAGLGALIVMFVAYTGGEL